MSDNVVKVENLSKRYILSSSGGRTAFTATRRFSDALAASTRVRAPFRRWETAG